MPSGDASRTWFPGVIAALSREWDISMSMTDLIELRNRLNDMVQAIRTGRTIATPGIKRPNCKTRHYAAKPKVFVLAPIRSPAFGFYGTRLT